jgi:Zn-dependent peptidase ImmA (M78 family)
MPGASGSYLIILNSMLPPSAQRYALAHELGHLVMHNGTATADMERDADEFAAALLMPADDIRPELRGIRFRDLGPLKPRWRVSLAALIRQAHRLGHISDRQYRTFNMELNRLPGGRKREPGEFEPEHPRLMRHILAHYNRELGYSRNDLLNLLVMTPEQHEAIYQDKTTRRLRAVSSSRTLYPVTTPGGTDF